MVIKVLGKGCPKCKKVEERARAAVAELGIDAEFVKVTDMMEIQQYPIASTPGLVVDENVVCSGRIPKIDEVKSWLQTAT